MNILSPDFLQSLPIFVQTLIRLALSVLVTWVLVDRLYYPKSHRRDFYFTFMLIGLAIFILVYFMIFCLDGLGGRTSMGIGIGLFGIFSIVRYRTDGMPVREMTYLFIIIALSVVNAIASKIGIVELLSINCIVALATWIFELRLKVRPSKLIQYDRIAFIRPDRRQELIEDLQERTGLVIERVEVGAIDFLKDMAVIKIYYSDPDARAGAYVDNILKLKKSDWRAGDKK